MNSFYNIHGLTTKRKSGSFLNVNDRLRLLMEAGVEREDIKKAIGEQSEFMKGLEVAKEKEEAKELRYGEVSQLRAESSAETAEEQRELQMKTETVNHEQQDVHPILDDYEELVEDCSNLIAEVFSEIYGNKNDN